MIDQDIFSIDTHTYKMMGEEEKNTYKSFNEYLLKKINNYNK